MAAPKDAQSSPSAQLSAADLIVDRALGPHDPDALEHQPIADRVADLVTVTEPPINIALFGAWGSGKSSFARLLDGALKSRRPKARLVVYDAWTFEGESLQRNFISAAANALALPADDDKYRDFHGGLYQSRRSAAVELSSVHLKKLALAAAAIAVGLLSVTAVVVAIAAYLTGNDVLDEVLKTLSALIPASAVAGLLGGITRDILAGARVEIDQSAPTQEQFRARFAKLVDTALRVHSLDRIVFFVDELDRCSPKQVVQILAAIRHFFDQEHSLFVVAADRQVIEQALAQEGEQATPVNRETPYYSSASEYIDKVFQHQLALPPLRGRRLTRFARDLVQTKTGGLWSELAAHDSKLRDQIIYVLVPSHIRSPRRVKVLLNNFATNARIAQSRGVNWLGHALEVAKLTALRTEFPRFAADLPLEPRLPELLIDVPAKPSPRVEQLLRRHKLPVPTPAGSEELTAADPIVSKPATGSLNADDMVRNELAYAQRTNLRRYLVRTRQFPNPSRDLLYLEPAGATVDLEDQAFGELLESAAIERPAEVVAAAEQQPPEEQRKALSVLADMVINEFGEERGNVTATLLGIAHLLHYDLAARADEVLGALRQHQNEEPLAEQHLAPALAVALSAEQDDRSLSDAVLGDARLMASAEQVRRVALIADKLDKSRRKRVWGKVAEFYAADAETMLEPLQQLPADVAEDMLDNTAVHEAITSHIAGLSAAEAEAEADHLFERAKARTDKSGSVRGTLLWYLAISEPNAYAAAAKWAHELEDMADDLGLRNAVALSAIRVAPAPDWAKWLAFAAPAGDDGWDDEGEKAIEAVVSVLERRADAAGIEDSLPALLGGLAQFIKSGSDHALVVAVESPLESALGTANWWATPASAEPQMHLHDAALRLHAVGEETAGAVSEIVVNDLLRALAARITAASFEAVSAILPGLAPKALTRLATSLAGLTITPSPSPLDAALSRSRLAVGRAARAARLSVKEAPFAVSADLMIELLAGSERASDLADWYGLGPGFEEGKRLLLALDPQAPTAERNAAASWTRTLTATERTDLLLALLDQSSDIGKWAEAIGAEPLDDVRLVQEISRRIRSAPRGDERAELARSLAAIRPRDPAAQRAVADLIIWLLEQEKRVDFDAAVLAVPAVGTQHRSGQRLSDAFDAAAQRGHQVNTRAGSDLEQAGVRLRKRSVPEKVWDRLRGRR